MTLEEDLRLTLMDHAEQPAPPGELLDAVRRGVRRDKRRRTVLAGAAAALVAVVAVPVVLVAREHPAAPHLVPPAPTSAASASAAPASAAATSIVWERSRWSMPSFPLTPGWLWAGAGDHRVDRVGPQLVLTYRNDHADVLSMSVGAVPGSWEVEGDRDHASTVGRAAATVRTAQSYDGGRAGDHFVGVRWKLADGRWAQVLSYGPRTEAEVLRVARGLRTQTVPASPAPFRLAEVPRGLVLSFVTDGNMCLTPPPVTEVGMQRGLCVSVDPEPQDKTPGVPITVAGRPGVFTGPGQLQIELGEQRVLTVTADTDTLDLTADDLVRFATGVRVTGS